MTDAQTSAAASLREQWTRPADISILLLLGDHVVQLALTSLAGRALTPLAFSFGSVARAVSAAMRAQLDRPGPVTARPDASLSVINLATGCVRENQSWVLARLVGSYRSWMPPAVRDRDEDEHAGFGRSLIGHIFPGRLLEWDQAWWDDPGPRRRQALLRRGKELYRAGAAARAARKGERPQAAH